MRRSLLGLFAIVAATTLLVSVKSAPGASRTPNEIADALAAARASAAASASATPGPLDPSEGGQQPLPGESEEPGVEPTPDPTVQPTSNPTRPPATKPPTKPTGGPILGDSIVTDYGYVQVSVVISAGKLTDVIVVELPSREPRSVRIGERAAPILRQEALTAQSADIDTVSGATYTSDGYRRSLQSALDRAGALSG